MPRCSQKVMLAAALLLAPASAFARDGMIHQREAKKLEIPEGMQLPGLGANFFGGMGEPGAFRGESYANFAHEPAPGPGPLASLLMAGGASNEPNFAQIAALMGGMQEKNGNGNALQLLMSIGNSNAKPLELLQNLLEQHALKTLSKSRLDELKSSETQHVENVVSVAKQLTKAMVDFDKLLESTTTTLGSELEEAAVELSTLDTPEALAVVAGVLERCIEDMKNADAESAMTRKEPVLSPRVMHHEDDETAAAFAHREASPEMEHGGKTEFKPVEFNEAELSAFMEKMAENDGFKEFPHN